MTQEMIPGHEFTIEKHPRYDGHFLRAIVTTGIYCRPVCPSRPARAENVLFFSTAAAAAEAGFRPCLRCRPESAPERPDGVGVSRLVRNALQLIADDVSGRELADRMHMSARQLRRRFVQELGAPPVAIIQTRKLLFAKKLIDETTLSMADVAFSAGYSSVRRFNDAIRQTYGRTPTEIRQSRRNKTVVSGSGSIRLKLFYRPPYAWDAMWRYLGGRAIPGVEHFEEGRYRRTIRFEEVQGILSIQALPEKNCLLLDVPERVSPYLLQIAEQVKRQFDLRADPAFVADHFKSDPILAPLVEENRGLRVPGAWDGFEVAVRAILGQQVSVQAATTLAGRLVERFGERLREPFPDDPCTHLFPTPHALATADVASIGLPKKRAETINGLARAVAEERLKWQSAATLKETLATFTALPGIGPWTAEILAMRVLGEVDVFPAGDLVLRQAVTPEGDPLIKAGEFRKLAEPWRPFRSYAAQLLWAAHHKKRLANRK